MKVWCGCDILYIPVILFQVAKVLSPKKSQLVGILLSSLRVDVSDIEHGKVLILYMNTVMYFLKCLKLKKKMKSKLLNTLSTGRLKHWIKYISITFIWGLLHLTKKFFWKWDMDRCVFQFKVIFHFLW